MKKIYLAGPEVFLPDSIKVLEHHKSICKEFGFLGLSPFDGEVTTEKGLDRAEKIFLENCKLILQADIILANCNTFRGALVDDGTSFEIGYAHVLQKKIYGFIDSKKILPEIVASKIPTTPHESGYRIDSEGYLLNEDFGNSINLMLEFAIKQSGGSLVEGNFLDTIRMIQQKEI
jgi:nucleoside 2-deoxyribosyltransferase